MKSRLLVLSGLFAGVALSRDGSGSGAVHPFARYKALTAATTEAPAAPTQSTLECFQVAEPVLTDAGLTRRDISQSPAFVAADQAPIGPEDDEELVEAACTVVLMQHVFENSYGAPYVGSYTPPPCDFDHVTINFTTTVKGRQYDRTGVMYLTDNEVWRTSTAEPTSYGIRWEWLKDMTPFLSLWKKPQTLVFDLENIVDSTYTGLLSTTLTATFYKAAGKTKESHPPADLIIPISQRIGNGGKPSQFVYPASPARNTLTNFPRNVNRAVFTVDVKGQGNEEFWWSNVPQSAAHAFEATYGEYPGYSPFREVQVLIDGHLAGVSWPFPVIYTGGVVPQLHRPIVGIQAFDIAEHEIDISPFLPLLCDGKQHTFEIKIVGLVDNGASSASLSTTTDDEWYITGKIFVWLDDEGSITTGTTGVFETSSPKISLKQHLTQNATGFNESLEYDFSLERKVHISSQVKTQKTKGTVSWTQFLTYTNTGGVASYGNYNLNKFLISGTDSASGPGVTYATKYAYPLFANSTYNVGADGSVSLWAQVDQGLQVEVRGNAVFPTGIEGFVATGAFKSGMGKTGSITNTWRNGTASYYRPGNNSFSRGVGQTHQVYSFSGIRSNGGVQQLYFRDVSAFNDTVTADTAEIAGR